MTNKAHLEVFLHLNVVKQKYTDTPKLPCEEARKAANQYIKDCRKMVGGLTVSKSN